MKWHPHPPLPMHQYVSRLEHPSLSNLGGALAPSVSEIYFQNLVSTFEPPFPYNFLADGYLLPWEDARQVPVLQRELDLNIKLVAPGACEEEPFEVDDQHLWHSPQVQLLVGLHVALAVAAEPAVLGLQLFSSLESLHGQKPSVVRRHCALTGMVAMLSM